MSNRRSQITSPAIRRGALGLVLALALGSVVYALGPEVGGFRDAAAPGSGDRIVASDGQLLRQTDNLVRNLRIIALPESSLELYLWDEQSPAGDQSSHYAVFRPGEGLSGRVRETDYAVELADVRFDPLLEGEPGAPAALTARHGNRLFLVQLLVTPLPELQQQIRELGGRIHRYYTQHTLLVEMDGAVRAAVEALPFVRWVGAYHPAYRVPAEVRQALAGEGPPLATERYSIMVTERGEAAQQAMAGKIRLLGGTVDTITPQGFRMEATLVQAQLAELVHDNQLHFADIWGPGEVDMDIVRQVGGADYVEAQTGYTGQGVRGEIFDTELRTTHQEWLNPPIIHSTGTSGSLHGTSCFSNVFAQGVNPQARGMAPDGQGIFFRYSESTQFGGPISRYTISQELLDPAGPYRAVFQTASVGSPRTFEYTTISAEMDDILLLHQVLHTQSQSNACSDPAGPQNSRPQAWAKNMVAVGAVRHQNTAIRDDDFWCTSSGASIGPAADGRIKPDLSFFYDSIFSASGAGDTSYTSFGGTSSATPQTAGHFGMLFQMWHEGVWAGHGGGPTVFDSRPHLVTAKALMIHHAYRYNWVSGPPANADITRDIQGWGTANLQTLLDTAGETRILDEEVVLGPLESYVTSMPIQPGTPELKATMSYLDPMGTPGAGVHRINDLTLKVTSPTGTVYWGNNGLRDDNFSLPGGVSNTIDTVEVVVVINPEPGLWTVEVLADEVVQDAHLETPEVDVDFALILSPDASTVFTDGFESGDTSAWSDTCPPTCPE